MISTGRKCANRLSIAAIAAVLVGASAGIAADDTDDGSRLTVNEIMLVLVAPASDSLWGIESPQSDADWQALDNAAVALIAAGRLLQQSDAKIEEASWSDDPAWQQWLADLLGAANTARRAIRNRDIEGVVAVGEPLYTPCEGCHLAFHPGVRSN